MSSPNTHPLLGALAEAWPPDAWRNCHVMVALSGGADSVALLLALQTLRQHVAGRGQLMAAHYNHRLRGDDSDADQQWVTELCASLSVPLVTGQAIEPHELASEEGARDARYAFLKEAAHRAGARYVATAHTADDQVETVLMRLFRGAGLRGLAAIPFSRPLTHSVSLVRPLLHVRRAQVEDYLTAAGQSYRTDASNFSADYTRNWIRNELLPLLRQQLPHPVDDSLLRLASHAHEWGEAIETLVELLASNAIDIERDPPRVRIDCGQVRHLPAILLQEACRWAWREACWPERGMRQADWRRLAQAVLEGNPGAFELPGAIRVEVSREAVWLAPAAS